MSEQKRGYLTEPLTPKNASSEIGKAINFIFEEKIRQRQLVKDLNRENHLRIQAIVMHSGNWDKIQWR